MSVEKRLQFEEIEQKALDFNRKGDNENAIFWYEKGAELALALHTFANDLSPYQGIEGHYKNDPNFDQAYWDLSSQIHFFSQYAGCLCVLNHLDKAHEIAQIAQSFLDKTDFLRPFRKDLYTLGSVYFQRQEFQKAAQYYAQTLTKYELDLGNSDGQAIGFAFVRKGLCHWHLGERELAKATFTEGEKAVKLTAVGKNFFIYYFLYQISISDNDEKQANKYKKMYLNRLKKEDLGSLNEQFDDNFIAQSDREKIMTHRTQSVS
ncbi:MAG: hypothetical protein Q4C98_09665 [Capnocytophaga sp.]|nr:hypothetical protein [Capnocytophaga sp.]